MAEAAGYRDQQAGETEQRAKGKEREHQPDRVQADTVADQLGLQDVALDRLADEEDGGHHHHRDPVGPELDDGDPDRQHQPDQRGLHRE